MCQKCSIKKNLGDKDMNVDDGRYNERGIEGKTDRFFLVNIILDETQ